LKDETNILFWLRKNKVNKAGTAPIICRITVHGQRVDFSTKVRVSEKKWNAKAQKIVGSSEETRTNNLMLESIRNNLKKIWLELENKNESITAEKLKDLYFGQNLKIPTFLEVFEEFVKQEEKRFEMEEITKTSFGRIKNRHNLLEEFLRATKQSKLKINEVQQYLFNDLKFYFLKQKQFSLPYTQKTMQGIGTVLKYAKKKGYVEQNIFEGFSMKVPKSEPDFLDFEHLKILEEYVFSNPTFDKVRDFFIFSCYTGLAWTDYDQLSKENLFEIEGKLWLKAQRQKGKKQNYGEFVVPLVGPALAIFQKYGSLEDLPRMTNQSFNRILKEVQAVVGIERGKGKNDLHCHLARHTFVWIALNKWNLDKDTVAAMVGHSSIQMLDIYAKIGIERITSVCKEKMQ